MFVQTGYLCKASSPSIPHVSSEDMERMSEVYQQSPHMLVAKGSRELCMLKTTMESVL